MGKHYTLEKIDIKNTQNVLRFVMFSSFFFIFPSIFQIFDFPGVGVGWHPPDAHDGGFLPLPPSALATRPCHGPVKRAIPTDHSPVNYEDFDRTRPSREMSIILLLPGVSVVNLRNIKQATFPS